MGYAGLIITHLDLLRVIHDNARGKNIPLQSEIFATPRYKNRPYHIDYMAQKEQPRYLAESSPVDRPPDGNIAASIYADAKYERARFIRSVLKLSYERASAEINRAIAQIYNSGHQLLKKRRSGKFGLELIVDAA